MRFDNRMGECDKGRQVATWSRVFLIHVACGKVGNHDVSILSHK